jgi:hypothetical protein
MSKDFNWQTDDHNTWEEEPSDSPAAQPSRQARLISWFRKWGRWLGLAAGLLVVVGIIV